MKTPLDPRHQRREKIVQELFAWNAQQNLKSPNDSAQGKQISNLRSDTDERTRKITKSVKAIDEIIKSSAPEWEISKINGVDLAILRLAVYELVIEGTEPAKAIIDEAVELAKEFGGDNSPSFVNGALGKVLVSKERILRLLANKLGVEVERLVPEASLVRDLNVTELETADLMATLEKELNITFTKDSKLETVGELLENIEDQVE